MNDTVHFYIKPSTDLTELNGTSTSAHPSFPSRVLDNETAKGWSDNGEVLSVPNTFDKIKIIDLDFRGRGGRAYQVLLEVADKYVTCDLREDSLLDIITHVGIGVNGVVSARFKFLLNGSQFKLYRVGSKYDLEALKLSARVTVKKPEIGKIYTNQSGHLYQYMGRARNCYDGDRLLPPENKLQAWCYVNEYHQGRFSPRGLEFVKSKKVYEVEVLSEYCDKRPTRTLLKEGSDSLRKELNEKLNGVAADSTSYRTRKYLCEYLAICNNFDNLEWCDE